MERVDRDFVVGKLVLVFGVLGFLVFSSLFFVELTSDSEGGDIGESVVGEFRIMSETMLDASAAAENAAISLDGANSVLTSISLAGKKSVDTVKATGDTVGVGASVSADVGNTFHDMGTTLSMLGFGQLKGVSDKFFVLSSSLENASKDISSVSEDLLDAANNVEVMAGHLKTNSEDMQVLSSDFKDMSAQLDLVSEKMGDEVVIPDFRRVKLFLYAYLSFLHVVVSLLGFSLFRRV